MIRLLIILVLLSFISGTVSGFLRNVKNFDKADPVAIQQKGIEFDETDEYNLIRDRQLVMNKTRSIQAFIDAHSLGIRFVWTGNGTRTIKVIDEDGVETLYNVYYKHFGDVDGEVFTLQRAGRRRVSNRMAGKVHKVEPLLRCAALFREPPCKDYAIYTLNRGKNIDTAERLREQRIQKEKSKDLTGFYANILQQKTDELQRLAYDIAESGNPVKVMGADYNLDSQPTKKELRALAGEFESLGFVVGPINFSLGELTLSLESNT